MLTDPETAGGSFHSFAVGQHERYRKDTVEQNGDGLFEVRSVHGAEAHCYGEVPINYGVVLLDFGEGDILDDFLATVVGVAVVPGGACFFQLYAGIVGMLLQFDRQLLVIR